MAQTSNSSKGVAATPGPIQPGVSERRTLSLLFVSTVIVWMTMMSVFPILPSIADATGYSASSLGALFGVSSLIMTLMAPAVGVAADLYGRRPLIIGGLLVGAIAMAIAAVSAPMLIVGWMVFGVARGLYLSPTFTVPADVCAPNQRGRAIGTLSAAIGIGSVSGYVYGGLLETVIGWRGVLAANASLLAIAGLLCLALLPETRRERINSTVTAAVKEVRRWASSRVLIVSGIVAMLAFTTGVASTLMVPFELSALETSQRVIALSFIPFEIVSAISSIALGRVGDRRGRKPALMIGLIVIVASLIGLTFVPPSLASILTLYALVGIAEGPIIGLCSAMVVDMVMKIDFRSIGSALGTQRLISGAGAFIGPLIGGILVSSLPDVNSRFAILLLPALLAVGLVAMLPETNPPERSPDSEVPSGKAA